MKLNITHFLIFLLIILNFSFKTYAQNNDIIINKLESLERDIRDVQRKIYQSKEEDLNLPSNNQDANNSVTSKGLANHELRLIEIEEQYRKTNGLIEELTFQINKLQKDYTLLQESINELSDKLNNINISSNNGDIGNNLLPTSEVDDQSTNVDIDSNNSSIGVLARINPDGEDEIVQSSDTSINEVEKPSDNQTIMQEQIIVPKDPKEIYQRAYNMLSTGEYEAAEAAFTKFIKDYPKDKLSSNAYYWLGETFYVRKNYQLAAYNFAAGFKEFPDGSKAPDQLLKLGISLYSLEKLTESCATFKKLIEEFPEMPTRILNRANSFQERLECK